MGAISKGIAFGALAGAGTGLTGGPGGRDNNARVKKVLRNAVGGAFIGGAIGGGGSHALKAGRKAYRQESAKAADKMEKSLQRVSDKTLAGAEALPGKVVERAKGSIADRFRRIPLLGRLVPKAKTAGVDYTAFTNELYEIVGRGYR